MPMAKIYGNECRRKILSTVLFPQKSYLSEFTVNIFSLLARKITIHYTCIWVHFCDIYLEGEENTSLSHSILPVDSHVIHHGVMEEIDWSGGILLHQSVSL